MHDLDGIFDDLTPEDFSRHTTAIYEVSRNSIGMEEFNAFVEEQLRALPIAYAAADGNLVSPIAILANPRFQRIYKPTETETLGDYIDRLQEEASSMDATWVFVSRPTQAAVRLVDHDNRHDAADPETLKAAEGALQSSVIWYAERREGAEIQRRIGALFDDGDGVLHRPVEANNRIEAFEKILGGDPDG